MVHLKLSTQTTSEKKIKRLWHLVDLKDKVLGRSLPAIATLLQGKHKPQYTKNIDCGDYVVVINARLVVLTGDKKETKKYDRFSGYPGGLKQQKASDVLKKNPSYVVLAGVSGMLPKNKLRDKRLARLFVFADENHTYANELKNEQKT